MTLKLYNTLTRQKEAFQPDDPKNVRMYVCGPTVYDDAHIGNARPIIVFDVLFRLLRHVYSDECVTYARNITDVEDKINARALDEGIEIAELTARTTARFHEDIGKINILPPTVEPRATDHIDEMKQMIEGLVAKGHAYSAEGHVLFHVPSMTDYGALSRRSLDDMQAGARVEVAPYKKDPMDFVLWKPSKDGDPGWPSPCGIEQNGRPGWHIECSAMSWKHLGKTFDIHGGGIDLTFPHHENEVAQSRCFHGSDEMATVWMHNGFLQVEGEKMSKSLGNFITIRELLADWPGDVLRFNMLKTHYRQPIDWTLSGLEESAKVIATLVRQSEEVKAAEHQDGAFMDALNDDLNTPQAIAEMHRMNQSDETAGLRAAIDLLGFKRDLSDPRAESVDAATVEKLIVDRKHARETKNWAEADRIRDEIAALGVVLKDGPEGTTWELKR